MKKVDAQMSRHLIFLEKVFDRREVLFKRNTGPNYNSATSANKEEEWERIRQECVDAGLKEYEDRPFRHLRDITWQNFRRRTIAKLEGVKRGGKQVEELTECDKLVLAILGNISPPVTENASSPVDNSNNFPTEFMGLNFAGLKSETPNELFGNDLDNTQPFNITDTQSIEILVSPPKVHNAENERPPSSSSDVRLFDTSPPQFPSISALIENNSMHKVRNSMKRKRISSPEPSEYQKAKSELLRAEAEKLRAEADKFRAESEKLRAETELLRIQTIKIQLETALMKRAKSQNPIHDIDNLCA